MAKVAGEAVIGFLATRAAELGFQRFKPALERLRAARENEDEAEAQRAEQEIEAYVRDHLDHAEMLVDDILAASPGSPCVGHPVEEPPRITVLEAFLATAFGMVAQIPPGVVAVAGSLCTPDAVTVIDTRRGRHTRLRPPAQAGNGVPLLHLASETKDAVDWGVPRMWIVKPPAGTSHKGLVDQLTMAFEVPPDRGGTPQLADPTRLSAATLAHLSGLGAEHTRAIGRVHFVLANEVRLDTKSAPEQASEPPAIETPQDVARRIWEQLRGDTPVSSSVEPQASELRAASERVRREQEAAGLTDAFLRLDGAGIRELGQSLRARYDRAVQAKKAQDAAEAEGQESIDDALGTSLAGHEDSGPT